MTAADAQFVDDFDPEISDLIVAYDPETLRRLPVVKDDVVRRFWERGNRRAARIVSKMPVGPAGELEPDAVDALLLRTHNEIQRLSEEFRQGHRVRDLLVPLLRALRKEAGLSPLRIVDVGCGPGYMVRWLASFGDLGDDVEIVGADYNAALIERGKRLAAAEGLRCRFEVANAFTLETPATVFISVGVIHHFRGPDLQRFFAQQAASPQCAAFAHFDIRQSWLAPLGAWLFHQARMREPLARHDGVLSALRAHQSETLVHAAREASDFEVALFDEDHSPVPMFKVMHAIVGVRSAYKAALMAELSDPGRLEFVK